MPSAFSGKIFQIFSVFVFLVAFSAENRAQAIELLGKAEAVRENERLKSVLLDAITHDFKTPLTSIKASATSLLEDLEFDKNERKELLVVIDEDEELAAASEGEKMAVATDEL